MKSCKYRLLLAALVLLGCTLQWGCIKDWDCHDEKVGDIYLDESTRAFFPLDTSKALVFRNAAGDEMRFVCKNPTILRLSLGQEVKCVYPDLSYSYKSVDSDYWELPFYQDSNYSEVIQMRFIVSTKSLGLLTVKVGDKVPFYDSFVARLGFDSSEDFGAAIINYITSQRDSDAGVLADVTASQVYREIPDTTILGKQFTDVLASVPGFGTQPDEHYSLLYQKNMGPIAFSTVDGTVYIFDRFE